MPVSYNYSPSYHAYAYGLMYSQTPEQSHANMSWAEAAYGSSVGVAGGYYTSQPPSSQTPPRSPEYNNPTSEGHYPASVMYYTDSKAHTQTGRLFLAQNRAQFDQTSKEQERAGSDTPSDSEAHTPGFQAFISLPNRAVCGFNCRTDLCVRLITGTQVRTLMTSMHIFLKKKKKS